MALADLHKWGINIQGSIATGASWNQTCPLCSHTRKPANRRDPCLWIHATGADHVAWKCHNCGETGDSNGGWVRDKTYDPDKSSYRPDRRRREAPKSYDKPADKIDTSAVQYPPKVLEYLTINRGLDASVCASAGLVYEPPRETGKAGVFKFPYYEHGELVNIKYRLTDKSRMWQTKNAKKVFWGIDQVQDCHEVIIVEGEFDRLALMSAGFNNVISVPSGHSISKTEDREDDARFEYLGHAHEFLKTRTRVILGVDMDAVGSDLEHELARRIGREKCYRIEWREKDANDVLVLNGADAVREDVAAAQPYPIYGLYKVEDFRNEVVEHYLHGMMRGKSTGWQNVDEYFTVFPGMMTVITGTPGSGKSEWVDCLTFNLAQNEDWKFALFSAENPKEDHVIKLAQKFCERSIAPNSQNRLTVDELNQAMDWIEDHYHFIINSMADEEDESTIDWILEKAKAAVLRHGINGLVIDPYNEVEVNRKPHQSETEYIGQVLRKIRRFAYHHGVHVFVIAHPTKMRKDKDGKEEVPTLYDIAGSANWANRADVGIVIHRPAGKYEVEIYFKKIRFKHVGKKGMAKLTYRTSIGVYTVPHLEEPYTTEGGADYYTEVPF